VLEPFAHVAAEAVREVPVPHVVVVRTGDLLGLRGCAIDFVARHVKRAVRPWNIPAHVRLADALRAGRARPAAAVEVGAEDLAFLAYTGGTTGVSKAAVILHRNVVAHTDQVAAIAERVLDGTPEGARALTALPLYHSAALMGQAMILPRHGGCAILVANPRDLDGLVATMRRERFTVLAGVNTLFRALLDHPKIGSVDFSHCKFFNAAAMATQKTVSDRWQALTGLPIIEGYGLSEATALVTCNPVDATSFSGSVGIPSPGTELSIRDEAGNPLPPGTHGEVCVRGPQVMAGYWRRPDETAKVMTADGFLRTGDIGSLDERGFLTLHDRKKDVIIVSGFNVYPNEVEAVLAAHPQVLEACVVGVDDAHSGEAVAASVVRRDPALDAEALAAHCRANLAAYKCPQRIEFADALPKSPVGKVLRRAVRDRWAGATRSG
jgi:long-chain acyl-CoA synthetase